MASQDKSGGRGKDRERDKPAADLLRRSLASAAGAPGSDIGACPDPEILAAYIDRSLDAEETARYELHFSQCTRCREQLAAMAHAAELAGAADEKRARTSGSAWNWDWRWLAPAVAALVFVAIVAVFRPPHYPAEKSPKPLVAMNQPAASQAAPPAEAIAKLGPAAAPPANAIVTPSAPIVAHSLTRSAPNSSSAESKVTPPAKASQASSDERKEFAGNSATNPGEIARLEPLKKTAAAPKAGVSSQSGNAIGYGVAGGSANGVGIPAAAPRAAQTVTVESEVSPVTPAAPVPADKKAAQANGAVSASDTLTQEATSAQQLSVVVANRDLMQTESVMVQANDATSAQTLVRSPDPQVLWRFSGGRYVERSTDAGVTWHVQWTNANAHLIAGVAPSSDSCWLVGRAGLVLVTVNGKKWKQVAPPADTDFVNVAATGASSATLTSADGRKFITSDRGNHWSPAP